MFVSVLQGLVRRIVMDGPIIVVMVKIVRVRSFVRRAERCQRLRSAHLQSKALQRQANQQQNAQELAHGGKVKRSRNDYISMQF